MTEAEVRSLVVERAQSWLGYSEADGRHKYIIDIYNSYSPLPHGYAMSYTDPWCAAFVSAVAISCGMDDVLPVECSCPRQIGLFQALGRWVEDDGHAPQPGDVIYYGWSDSGSGDFRGMADHVGIVETVKGGTMTVIEGNLSNAVGRRALDIGGKYIRGYGIPDYASVADYVAAWASPVADEPAVSNLDHSAALPELSPGSTGGAVLSAQVLLIHKWAISCGPDGADGDFGPNTAEAVRQFKRARGLESDGVVGPDTWGALIGGMA